MLFVLLIVCLFVCALLFLYCVARRGVMIYYGRIMYIMYSLMLRRGGKWMIWCFCDCVDCYGGCDCFFVRISFVAVIKIFLCLVGCVVCGA